MPAVITICITMPPRPDAPKARARVFSADGRPLRTLAITDELRREMFGRRSAYFRAQLELGRVHLLGHVPAPRKVAKAS